MTTILPDLTLPYRSTHIQFFRSHFRLQAGKNIAKNDFPDEEVLKIAISQILFVFLKLTGTVYDQP